MAEPWAFAGESASLLGAQGGMVTLVEESSFCISGRSGDIVPGGPQGLFFRDSRILSRFELRLNGHQPEPLAASPVEPFSASFVGRSRTRPGRSESTLMVLRHRYIG
ncbi:MAG: amylo-alpha-1,6-glucosidase, partial [Actinobacteria bacterium]